MRSRHVKSNSIHGSRSLSKLSSSDQNLARGSGNLRHRGRSHSNLSLGHAPSMTSVIEEPRKSTSTTSESCDQKMACILPIIPSYHVALSSGYFSILHIHILYSLTQMSQSMNMTHWLMPFTSGQTSLTFLATPKSSRSSQVTCSTSTTRHLRGGSGPLSGSPG